MLMSNVHLVGDLGLAGIPAVVRLHDPPQLARRIDGRLAYAGQKRMVRRLSATSKAELIRRLIVHGVEPCVTSMLSAYWLWDFLLNFDDIEWEAWGWVAPQC
jgi:hypothetical protein